MPIAPRFRILAFVLSLSAPSIALEPKEEARRLYAEGKAEYAQGHYLQAAELFERAYALSESPALLFNMAQAHRLAGPEHCGIAVRLYRSYLDADASAENRREVEERIQELGECANQISSTATPAAPTPATRAPSVPAPVTEPTPSPKDFQRPAPRVMPPPPPSWRRPMEPVLVMGAGTTLLVAGGILYGSAWIKHRDAEKHCPCYPGTFSTWEVVTNVSYALLATGAATFGGGLTWWLSASPPSRAQQAQGMLGFGGRF
ncbi:MAG TPA: hypothetical protein VFQ61_16575 [Polyangiaceae bacterium]|nr:hypothetical protein [Polyangiaceae bacterium]